MKQLLLQVLMISSLTILISSCNNQKSENKEEAKHVVYKKDTSQIASENVKQKAPIINITDTVTVPTLVLVIKDSAINSERMGEKMSRIYSKIIPEIAETNKLEIEGPKMAWYKKNTAPFFFEAGLPVNKRPKGKLPKNAFIREIKSDSCVVAHYFGPYDLTYRAYEAINEWMKDYGKKQRGSAYEIYIGELFDKDGKKNDPYRVQTDIVFPHK